MRNGRTNAPGMQAKVVVLTADSAFEDSVRSTFGASAQIGLDVIRGQLADVDVAALQDVTVVVTDLDAGDAGELSALERMMARLGNWPPVVAITQTFEEGVARRLMQMRVADFLVKPVSPLELVRTCARVAKSPVESETTEALIFTFLPAVGGAVSGTLGSENTVQDSPSGAGCSTTHSGAA